MSFETCRYRNGKKNEERALGEFKKYTHRLTRTYMEAYSIRSRNYYYLETDNRANTKAWLDEVRAIEKAEGVKFYYFSNCANDYVGEINKH